MYGAPDATLLVLSEKPLEQRAINALESSAAALGHAYGVCVASLSDAGDDLAAFIMRADPWSVVAIDDAAIDALRDAFPPASQGLKPDEAIDVAQGYCLVAVPDFAECLDDDAAKRIAWNRLKSARHPGHPIDGSR